MKSTIVDMINLLVFKLFYRVPIFPSHLFKICSNLLRSWTIVVDKDCKIWNMKNSFIEHFVSLKDRGLVTQNFVSHVQKLHVLSKMNENFPFPSSQKGSRNIDFFFFNFLLGKWRGRGNQDHIHRNDPSPSRVCIRDVLQNNKISHC